MASWRRWLRRLGIGLAGLVALVLGLLLAIVWIPALSQLVIREALSRWDATIPARVEWRELGGSIGAGLTIDGLALIDADEAPLVRVDRLALSLDLLALLRGTARVERLELRGVDVWADHRWADLGNPEAPPQPPKPGIGPDLPLTIVADVALADARVWLDARPLVELGGAKLHARGRGRDAEAELSLAGVALPDQDLRVDTLALVARWASPVAVVERLELASPLVDVERLVARYDVEARTGALSLGAVASLAASGSRLGVPLERVGERATITAHAQLGSEGLGGELDLDAAEQIQVHAELEDGALGPLRGHAAVELHGPGLVFDVDADVDREQLRARWSLTSPALARPLGLVASLLDLAWLTGIRGSLHAEGSCATDTPERLDTVECPLELRLRRAAGFGVGVDQLRLHARVVPLAKPLELDATLRVRGLALTRELELDELSIDAHGSLARLRLTLAGRGPHERLRLAGSLALGERAVIGLDRLSLRSDRGGAPTRVELLGATTIAVGAGAVDVDALALAAAEGRIELDGRLGLAAGVASDLRLALDSIRLERLDPLIPGPSLAGVVSANAALTGVRASPNLRLRARARGLEVASIHPGSVELVLAFGRPPELDADIVRTLAPALVRTLAEPLDTLDLAATSLRAYLGVRGPLAERMNVAVALPLELRPGPRLVRGEPLAVRVVVEGLSLVELGGLMPATPSWWRQTSTEVAAPPGAARLIPEGVVDLDLTLAGKSTRPRLAALVRARRLTLDRTRLGSLLARIGYADGEAGIELTAKPGFAQIELRGRVPVAVDLVRGRVDWSARDDRHIASLDVTGLDLGRLRATLGPKLPALDRALAQMDLDGLVSLDVRALGSLAAPHLVLALRAGGLRRGDDPLGDLRLFADYLDGEAAADLRVRGPLARRLDLHVEAPIELALLDAARPVRLDRTGRVRASASVEALELAALGRELGGPALSGRLGARLSLAGTLDDPRVDLRATVEQLARDEQALGDLLVRASYADARARLDADLIREGEQVLALAAEVPFTVASSEGLPAIAWDRAGHHRVFATARGVDEPLLAAAFGVVDESAVGAVATARRELALGFDVSGGGSLDAFRIDGAVDGRVEVDGELALSLAATLGLDQSRQRLGLTLTPGRGHPLTASVALEAAVSRLVGGQQRWGQVPFVLDLSAPNFDLGALAGLLPSAVVDPEGTLRGGVHGRGQIAAPRLEGKLVLKDAAITLVPMRQRLTGIALELGFDQQRVRLDALSLTAGRGGLQADGWAELAGDGTIESKLGVEIDDFPLVRPGLPAMTVDSRVDVELHRAAQETSIAVELHEPEVLVAGTNEGAPAPIPTSDDVIFVHAAHAPEPERPSAPAGAAERLTFRLALVDPLLITGSMMDMAWAGALELDVIGGAVEAGGQLDARRGRLRLLSNSFEIRRGVVTLPADGSLDPFLDLEAVSDLPEAEVTVTVRGRLSRPTLEFSSSPPLTDYQIVTLLVTGSTELQEGEGNVAAKAASLLAAVSNPELQAQLQRSLGLDRVSLGFGENIDQPILTIGKRITREVYVETSYHHNAPADENTTQVSIEYDFKPRWMLETYFGNAAVGAIGVFWTRSFPAPAWSSDLALPELQINGLGTRR